MDRRKLRCPTSMPVLFSLTNYEPLDHESDTIRLIELLPGNQHDVVRCNILYAQLSTQPEYAAVSYTWVDKHSKCTSLLWLDGRPCHVRPMLRTLLETLRDKIHTVKLWIDAVCIDQKNLREKSHQVGMMGRIYKSARLVVSYLGRPDDDSDLGLDFIDSIDLSKKHVQKPNPAIVDAIFRLCFRDYWFRAWIRQEILLARKISLYCGQKRVPWDKFAFVCGDLLRSSLGDSPVLQLIQEQGLHRGKQFMSLQDLIRKYGFSDCENPRDKVYALISLATDCCDGRGIQPDYACTMEDLSHRVLDFCKAKDNVEFRNLIQDTLLPDGWYAERLADLDRLLSDNTDLQYSIRELINLARHQRSEQKRQQYLDAKAKVVWQVVAGKHPNNPARFQTVFEGEFRRDRASARDISFAADLQTLLNASPRHLAGRIRRTVYPLLQRSQTGSSGLMSPVHTTPTPSRSSANQNSTLPGVFWDLISDTAVRTWHPLTRLEYARTLRKVFTVSLSPHYERYEELEHHLQLFPNYASFWGVRDLLVKRLRAMPVQCLCKDHGDFLCCPLDTIATFWHVVSLIWGHMSIDILPTRDTFRRAVHPFRCHIYTHQESHTSTPDELYDLIFPRPFVDTGQAINEQAVRARDLYNRVGGFQGVLSLYQQDNVALLLEHLATPVELDTHHTFDVIALRPIRRSEKPEREKRHRPVDRSASPPRQRLHVERDHYVSWKDGTRRGKARYYWDDFLDICPLERHLIPFQYDASLALSFLQEDERQRREAGDVSRPFLKEKKENRDMTGLLQGPNQCSPR